MARITVKISNPERGTGSRTSLEQARRAVRKNRAVWVKEDEVIRYFHHAPEAPRGLQVMWPARLDVIKQDMLSTSFRAAVPAWPPMDVIKKRERDARSLNRNIA